MEYLEALSVASFIIGGVSVVCGFFLAIILSSTGSYLGNSLAGTAFSFGMGLVIFFWIMAYVILPKSKGLQNKTRP